MQSILPISLQKEIRYLPALFVFVATILTTLPARAVVVTTSPDAPLPAEALISIAENSAVTNSAQWRYNGATNRRDVGQTFLIPDTESGSSIVTGFTFRIANVTGGIGTAAANAAFSLSIYSFASETAVNPSGSALYTSTGNLTSTLTAANYLTFSLETPISLTENQYYGVVLTFPTMLANESLNFVTAGPTTYASGTGIFYQLSSGEYAYQSSNGDFQMYVMTSAIPEPQTYLLISIACVLVLLNRQRLIRRVALPAAVLVLPLCQPLTVNAAIPQHTILLLGDSTVVNYAPESPIQGWGNFLPKYLNSDWAVINLAKGGASTKTYVTLPQWKEAQQVQSDFVFIQFGHNDAHGPNRPESTDANSDYKTNLKRFITWAREKGSTPILVTPMHRRTFAKNGTLNDSLLPYANAVRAVGAEENVPIIDLHTPSGELFMKLGEASSTDLTGPNNDLSHFSPKGADWLASCVAEQAKEISPTLAAAFKPAP